MRKHVIVGLAVLMCLGPQLHAEEIFERLHLSKAEGSLATVYYDPQIKGDIQAALTLYDAYCAERAAARLHYPKNIIPRTCELVGLDPAGKWAKDTTTIFAQSLALLSLKMPTVCLVSTPNIKRLLKESISLPGFTYDREKNEFSYSFRWTYSAELKEIPPLSIPAADDETVEKTTQKLIDACRANMNAGSLIEQIVASALNEKVMVLNAGRARWFRAGCTIYLTANLLREQVGEASANAYVAKYAVKPEDVKETADLAYWAPTLPETASEETDLTEKRRRFAAAEVHSIVRNRNADFLIKLLESINQNANQPEPVYAAIHQATGIDMQPRLAVYQHFDTVEKGLDLYEKQFKEAQAQKQWREMLQAALRHRDLQGGLSITEDSIVAAALRRLGKVAQAYALLDRTLRMAKVQGASAETMLQLGKAYCEMSLEAQSPEKAASVAIETLAQHPKCLPALTIRMLSLKNENRTAEAKDLANQILAIEQSGDSEYCRLAKQIRGKSAASQPAGSSDRFRL